jgi:hypothetical protein
MADAKRMNARTKESPGSSLDPRADIDIAPTAVDTGNRYIKSIVKFITAWIKK